MILDYPKSFEGTPEQEQANYDSHEWRTYRISEDESVTECIMCYSKSYHTAASYPCGTEPPRIKEEIKL